MFDGLKRAGSQFAFEVAMELSHPLIIDGFRKWLEQYSLDQYRDMIRKGTYPAIKPEHFEAAKDYADYIQGITVDRLIDFLAEARPDIVEVIVSMGDQGGNWLINLREHFLDCLVHPEKAGTGSPAPMPQKKMKTVTCDKCGKSFPMEEEAVAKLEKCPLCGAPNS